MHDAVFEKGFCDKHGRRHEILHDLPKKPNQVKVSLFLQRAAALNGYVVRLQGSYYSWDATEATKKIVPHDNAEFAMNMLHAMPKTWKQQYHLGHKAPPNVEYLQNALEKIEVAFLVDGSGMQRSNGHQKT